MQIESHTKRKSQEKHGLMRDDAIHQTSIAMTGGGQRQRASSNAMTTMLFEDKLKHHKKAFIFCGFALILCVCLFFVIWFVITSSNLSSSSKADDDDYECIHDRYLVVIAMDGFSAEYLTDEYQSAWNISTPNLHELRDNGVEVSELRPVFPSITFPNMYTIATGMYPRDHGIILNSFYDGVLDDRFGYGTVDTNGEWYRGTPIWLTHRLSQQSQSGGSDGSAANAERFRDYKSANVFWVGSDQNASGLGYPDFYLKYNQSMPFSARMHLVADLLQTREYRLVMVYFHEPDSTGHTYGPHAMETALKVQEMDGVLGQLMDSLKDMEGEMFAKTDIIVLADHGMTEFSADTKYVRVFKTSALNVYEDTDDFMIESKNTNLFIRVLNNTGRYASVEDVMALLRMQIENADETVDIYSSESVPFMGYSHQHLSYNERLPEIMVVFKPAYIGYQFYFVNTSDSMWSGGNHGYNNSFEDMSSVFVAHGPSFKQSYVKPMVENIHLYPLFCELMCGMEPANGINGSLAAIQDILRVQD